MIFSFYNWYANMCHVRKLSQNGYTLIPLYYRPLVALGTNRRVTTNVLVGDNIDYSRGGR